MLWHRFSVRTCDRAVSDAIQPLGPLGHQQFPELQRVAYEVRPSSRPSGYDVWENGDHFVEAPTAAHVHAALHERMHQRVAELTSRSGWVRLHAASVDIDQRRVLIVGRSGAGKTTTAVRLALDGAQFGGDECVLLRRGVSVPVPRRIHLKHDAEQWVAELASMREVDEANARDIPDAAGWSVDPTVFGSWNITEAPVSCIVLLGAWGSNSVSQISAGDAMPRLADQVLRFLEPRTTIVQELAGLVRRVTVSEVCGTSAAAVSDSIRQLVTSLKP